MKRLIFILMLLCVILSLSTVVFASENVINAVLCDPWYIVYESQRTCYRDLPPCDQSDYPPFTKYYRVYEFRTERRQCENFGTHEVYYEDRDIVEFDACTC